MKELSLSRRFSFVFGWGLSAGGGNLLKFFLVIAKIDRRLLSEKNIKHNDYINTLFNNEQICHKVKTIRSVNRELGSYEVIVTRHLAFDDKRYMHEDGVTCYASGHY